MARVSEESNAGLQGTHGFIYSRLSPTNPPHAPRTDVNAQDCTGRTPLHLAVALGNVSLAQVLLHECGADRARKDRKGRTALALARSLRGDKARGPQGEALVVLLLSSGLPNSDDNHENEEDKTERDADAREGSAAMPVQQDEGVGGGRAVCVENPLRFTQEWPSDDEGDGEDDEKMP